jgi:hypothetical protein
MLFPIKVCVICSEEFELKPDKPGYANRCPECSAPEAVEAVAAGSVSAGDRWGSGEVNAARRKAMRDLLYRRDE